MHWHSSIELICSLLNCLFLYPSYSDTIFLPKPSDHHQFSSHPCKNDRLINICVNDKLLCCRPEVITEGEAFHKFYHYHFIWNVTTGRKMSLALNTCLVSPNILIQISTLPSSAAVPWKASLGTVIRILEYESSLGEGVTWYCDANTGVWKQPGRKVRYHMESSIAEQAGNLSKVPQH